MPYVDQRIKVTVTEFRMGADGMEIGVRFQKDIPAEPIAPAALYDIAQRGEQRVELETVFRREGQVVTFKTYRSTADCSVQPGEVLTYQAWWTPAMLEAAEDVDAVWVRQAYPDDGSHDHCLFTWDTISAYGDNKVAYWCDDHGWITEKAYQEIIVQDVYRVRKRDA